MSEIRHAINPVFGPTLCGDAGVNCAPGKRINCPKCRVVINYVHSLSDRYSVPRLETASERAARVSEFRRDMYGDTP